MITIIINNNVTLRPLMDGRCPVTYLKSFHINVLHCFEFLLDGDVFLWWNNILQVMETTTNEFHYTLK
ncbi:hypothetical protein DPMN_128173 [Dreissena polymorpha]|uniref:Uncharacterized protein n=1 Tax=Dreissena polymorpha TaxID=45954 RepID=A0A9D4GYZ2_DREPO|nr:hypothetical protein DPMN_128173 [Dreissena polymorpha]